MEIKVRLIHSSQFYTRLLKPEVKYRVAANLDEECRGSQYYIPLETPALVIFSLRCTLEKIIPRNISLNTRTSTYLKINAATPYPKLTPRPYEYLLFDEWMDQVCCENFPQSINR